MVYASRMRSMLAILAATLGAAACGDDPGGGGVDAPPARRLELTAAVGADGLSEELAFAVPDRTRSITVVVAGATDALYALGALRSPDGTDLVALPTGAIGPTMSTAYRDEQIGQMPGNLYQSIRLGTFAHVYPYRPGQEATAGAWSLRVAADRAGPVLVTILMPEDDGGRTLHLNVVVVSDVITVGSPPTFLDEVQGLLAPAGITVAVDQVMTLPGTALERITEGSEPQEAPDSMAAMLPALVATRLSGGGFDLFVVEGLPPGVAGLSLGTPGPPLRGSYYYGVLVRPAATDTQTARVIAHELCHFLALQHVQNVGISGMTYPDPIDDTTVGTDNLMTSGTTLTAGQAFALSRSALLTML